MCVQCILVSIDRPITYTIIMTDVLRYVRDTVLKNQQIMSNSSSSSSSSKVQRQSSDVVLEALDNFAWNNQWMMFVGDGTYVFIVDCSRCLRERERERERFFF
jgi:hypothetical protein